MELNKKLEKILLVDDDTVSNNLAKRMVEKADVTKNISIVTDGQKALDYILNPQKSFPELIFLDISMPVMDGFQFLKKFMNASTEAREVTKVVILSAIYNETELKEIADYDSVIGYMQKPLTEEKVQEAVNYYFKKVGAV